MASKDEHERKFFEYNVEFYGDCIKTIVTSFPNVVNQWISETYSVHGEKFLVGLDTEWIKSDDKARVTKAVVLQLCVDRRCLVFQLSHTSYMPQALIDFLGDINLTFVGKEIKGDVKLLDRQGLHVSRSMDLSHMAVEKYGDKSYNRIGLSRLAMEILQKEMKKNKQITLSCWDVDQLSWDQVEYACIDAYVSFLLGDKLEKMCLSEEMKQLDSYSYFQRMANKLDELTASAVALIEEFVINFDYSSIVATGWDD